MLEDLNQKICTTRTLKEDGSLQEIETCRIPFDIEKAKNGADVRTQKGHKVTIFDYNFKEKCTGRIYIAGKIEEEIGDTLIFWDQKGEVVDTEERFLDLVILEEINYEYRWIVIDPSKNFCSIFMHNTEDNALKAMEKKQEYNIERKYQTVKIRVRK